MLSGFFSVLLVVFYLIFMIDWNEFRAVMKQGGWGTICIFLLLGTAIVYIIACPESGTHAAKMAPHH
ncbi:MAG: hypothetical protein P1P74_08935 [Desulfuromonadales bacterium]|nr:hypothetical protein [Desulfuromonadales bacterium]MDT8423590.1 hypothetical protein [Desulfuromonadales bacterium]